MNYFGEVKIELLRYKNLGEEVTEHGVLLIGRAPHVARLAWLHKIPPPLTDEDIIKIEDDLKMIVPSEYKFFLQHFSNGLGEFVSTFYLYGLRKELGRSIEASRQPFSISTTNIDERPENAKSHFFSLADIIGIVQIYI